jgi:hypothetical protein
MTAVSFDGRVMLSSLLAEFVCPSLPWPQRRLYRYQTDAEGRVVACETVAAMTDVLCCCGGGLSKIEFLQLRRKFPLPQTLTWYTSIPRRFVRSCDRHIDYSVGSKQSSNLVMSVPTSKLRNSMKL